MFHALNSVSGLLWHFSQPQPQQQGTWRSSARGLDPALSPPPFRHSQHHPEPSLTETQLMQGVHPRRIALLRRLFLRGVEALPRRVCRARHPGQHPILLLGMADVSFISQDPRFHANICCRLFFWGKRAFCGR